MYLLSLLWCRLDRGGGVEGSRLRSWIEIDLTQLTCRGAPRGYPRVEELVTLITGARYE